MTQIARVRAIGTGWTGAPGLMTAYFSDAAGAPISAAQALEAAKRVRSYLLAVVALVPATIVWDVNEQVDILEAVDGRLQSSFAVASQAAVPGTQVAATTLPPSQALVGQMFTNSFRAGRRVRGRTFYGPVGTTTATAPGEPTAAALASLITGLQALTTVQLTALNNIVWTRPAGAIPGASSTVVSYGAFSRFGSLRSRRD